jgi:NADH-quinone oxidoreductase subunit N
MFSMAGVPPTAGFYAKLLVIKSVIGAHTLWLAVVAVLFAVIGAYYYLRVVKLMYFDDAVEERAIGGERGMRWMLAINALALVAVVPWIGSLMELCQQIIREMA